MSIIHTMVHTSQTMLTISPDGGFNHFTFERFSPCQWKFDTVFEGGILTGEVGRWVKQKKWLLWDSPDNQYICVGYIPMSYRVIGERIVDQAGQIISSEGHNSLAMSVKPVPIGEKVRFLIVEPA